MSRYQVGTSGTIPTLVPLSSFFFFFFLSLAWYAVQCTASAARAGQVPENGVVVQLPPTPAEDLLRWFLRFLSLCLCLVPVHVPGPVSRELADGKATQRKAEHGMAKQSRAEHTRAVGSSAPRTPMLLLSSTEIPNSSFSWWQWWRRWALAIRPDSWADGDHQVLPTLPGLLVHYIVIHAMPLQGGKLLKQKLRPRDRPDKVYPYHTHPILSGADPLHARACFCFCVCFCICLCCFFPRPSTLTLAPSPLCTLPYCTLPKGRKVSIPTPLLVRLLLHSSPHRCHLPFSNSHASPLVDPLTRQWPRRSPRKSERLREQPEDLTLETRSPPVVHYKRTRAF